MSEKIKSFLKPSIAKLVITLFLLLWQYFYNYAGMKLDFMGELFDYITKGLGLVSWNNYFVRTGSLIVVWIFVAFIIFIGIWFFERISIFAHNKKIEKNYINQPKENYQDLLKEQKVSFKRHFLSNAIWAGGFILFLVTLYFISAQLEGIRFWALDTFMWNLIENEQEIDMGSNLAVIISFVAMVPFWYIISCTHVWIFKEGKSRNEADEIESEHVSVVIEKQTENEDNDSEIFSV